MDVIRLDIKGLEIIFGWFLGNWMKLSLCGCGELRGIRVLD